MERSSFDPAKKQCDTPRRRSSSKNIKTNEAYIVPADIPYFPAEGNKTPADIKTSEDKKSTALEPTLSQTQLSWYRALCNQILSEWNEKKEFAVWWQCKQADGIAVFKRQSVVPNRPSVFRAQFTVRDVPAKRALDVYYDTEIRLSWDGSLQKFNTLENLDLGNLPSRLQYTSYGSRGFIGARDFVDLGVCSIDHSSKRYIYAASSIAHPDYPPKRGTVRGLIYSSGIEVNSITASGVEFCKIILMMQVDMMGWVPSSAISSWNIDGLYDTAKALRNAIKKCSTQRQLK
eukprot:TRINITY_DN14145_c0_g1_i1.p1 TRINITY_DN14145_c0_g1~~TRINITY_DN14145_c0_g1_i1.p1  ORF type:complete len:303 (+),score=54.11 TRINITY_DN14145_c0_g1_i1:43-909(+)